jgi:hypothetical protein
VETRLKLVIYLIAAIFHALLIAHCIDNQLHWSQTAAEVSLLNLYFVYSSNLSSLLQLLSQRVMHHTLSGFQVHRVTSIVAVATALIHSGLALLHHYSHHNEHQQREWEWKISLGVVTFVGIVGSALVGFFLSPFLRDKLHAKFLRVLQSLHLPVAILGIIALYAHRQQKGIARPIEDFLLLLFVVSCVVLDAALIFFYPVETARIDSRELTGDLKTNFLYWHYTSTAAPFLLDLVF